MTQRGNDPSCRNLSKPTGLPQLLLLAANLGGGNWGVSTYQLEDGGIVHAFVLYFDAFFQSITLAKPALTYQVIAANELVPETFRTLDRCSLTLTVRKDYTGNVGNNRTEKIAADYQIQTGGDAQHTVQGRHQL